MRKKLPSGPIETPEAAKRYLRKKFADEASMDKTCDCGGCSTCTGFVVNCKCDRDMQSIRKAMGR